MDAAKDLYSTQFFPRHNIQRAVLDVNKLRHTKLNDYTFPDLVFIATFGARSNISKYTPVLIQKARRNPKFSFFENWLKYYKALQGHDRYLAVYEGVIYFTAEAFPQDEAQSWHQQHQNYLSRLQRISQANSRVILSSSRSPGSRSRPTTAFTARRFPHLKRGEASQKTEGRSAWRSAAPFRTSK
ncbi:hypothetical protein QWA68_015031 [Fusarium oxysporum]|nr:hypothetical protein QWA68_015031 [Fusarium oxysporum]